MPTDHEGDESIEFPDIDFVELSEHVRSENPGEREEFVATVTD
ncbi:hypothetical protein HNR06_004146 [Nocardiopsis arvandica]|uniref:Uncharacterized protein n=1 Tax=Nocardiopsis sinuspersici TaxID=501010 RepID=A0A7Z0BMG6_9ACTN|nr:hypothetical protein [Nocardiopsis sinuspersici]NYH54557.1 hypothetical protein [Nocardiopsis sinuspersici]